MATLLAVGTWLAVRILSTPRTAFLVTFGLVVLLDLAALPPRNAPEYDYREAFFRTDQVISAQVPAASGTTPVQAPASGTTTGQVPAASGTTPVQAPASGTTTGQVPAAAGTTGGPGESMLVLLVEPVFPAAAAQPPFGLAGMVGSTALAWDCAFQRGLQHLALPVPPAAVAGSGGPLDVRLHLSGSPTRESEYLLVYASAPRGGFLVSLVGAADIGAGTTVCTLHA